MIKISQMGLTFCLQKYIISWYQVDCGKRFTNNLIFTYRGVAQFGRALRSGRRGRGFESRRLDQTRIIRTSV